MGKIKKRRSKRSLARTDRAVEAFEREGRYAYWLAHGCNYLNSDLDEAHWSPLFPEIYEEGPIPSRQQIVIRVHEHFEETKEDGVEHRHNVLAAWALQKAKHIYPMCNKAMQEYGEASLDPRNGDVWGAFHRMIERSRDFVKTKLDTDH